MSYRKKHIHPRIRHLKNRKPFFKRPVFWVVPILIIFLAALYVLLFYSKFQVSTINVEGNQKISSADIQNAAWSNLDRKLITTGFLNISTKSIFAVDADAIINNILHAFPVIEKVQLQKNLPQNILLKVQERKPFAIFCRSASECFTVDGNGIIFEKQERIGQSAPVLRLPTSDSVFIGENVIPKNMIDMVAKIQQNLKNNFQIDTKEAFVSNPLIFTTQENWKIYFDPASDIGLQITKLDALLKTEITGDARKNLQYIYLQYKDKAYYK